MAMKMDVWQWGDVKGVDEELCNNLALFAEDNKIDCMNMTEKEFVNLKDEYLMKNYGNKGVFSKKSLKESKKFHYGEEIIKFLEKYGYNKRGEDFEQNKDYSTVTYMYAIPHGMRPQTPYVEFTVDADNDAFIFGEFFTDGRKGYSTEFDSVEDLEYFVSNANYSNVDLTEKKSSRKSLKEGINDELIATSSDGETTLYLSDERQANHGKDPHYEFKLGENGYFTRYIRCDDNRCENVVLDWIKEFDLDISKSEISKIIKLHESKKSVRKSMKESKASLHEDNVEYGVERIRNKVKGAKVTYNFDDEDCFIDVTEKNGNLWAFTIDFGSGYVYMLEPKEDRGSFGTDNEAFDVIISMLQGKRFNEKKSLKESSNTDRMLELTWDGLITKGEYDVMQRLSLADFEGGITSDDMFYIKPSAFKTFPKKRPSTNTWNCKGLVKWHDGTWKDIIISCELPQDYVLDELGITFDDIKSYMLLVRYVVLEH